jgi:diguanylate cyclase (GGDEF)-like protein
MTHPGTGLVLPESVLTSNWFILLATMVAFNTIIYVGLTLSKLVPMPQQFHPGRVRGWMRKLGMDPDKDTAADDIPRPELPDSPDPYENMRRGIARRDIPQAFGLVGALVILVATTALIAFRSTAITIHVVELFVGVLFLVCAQVLGRRHFRAVTVMWTWAMACVLLVGLMMAEAPYTQSLFPIAYAFVVMTAFAPITLSWRPSIAGAALMLTALITASQLIEGNEDIRLITAGIAALLVSATLLRLRLTAITALSDEKARSEALVTTDVLTGTLTPRGLLTIMPTVAGTAERTGEDVCLMYFGVAGLATANAQYGVHYGDDVLRAVAKAIQGTVRLGDLVARWGGDEFLVAGIGGKPSADDLARRIQEAVRKSGVNLGKWPITVKAGSAAGDPRQTTFDQLLLEARTRRVWFRTYGPTDSR